MTTVNSPAEIAANQKCDLFALIFQEIEHNPLLSNENLEIVLEDTLIAHDYMALVPIIEGAGGKVSDKYGKNINIYSKGSVIASANDKLHKQLIDIINN